MSGCSRCIDTWEIRMGVLVLDFVSSETSFDDLAEESHPILGRWLSSTAFAHHTGSITTTITTS